MRYIQDPETLKLIPANEYQGGPKPRIHIQGDIESYVSPVDGEVISDRGQERRYMRERGLARPDDFKEHWKQKAKEREDFHTGSTRTTYGRKLKQDRKQAISNALKEFGI